MGIMAEGNAYQDLKEKIKAKSKQLGFILAGVTSCEPSAHFNIFKEWLDQNKHGSMNYLAEDRSSRRSRR